MGFTLKKILSAVLMPLSLGLILFLFGLWFLYQENYKKAKFYLTVSFLWIFIISYSPFSNSIISPLESNYEKLSMNSTAKYILLLGGDYEGRAYEAIRLYNNIEGAKIITSGYAGRDFKLPEAIRNANKLMSLGIPKDDILIQSKPKDTLDEAKHIKKLIGDEPFILVTSAYHMPRAMELFKKEGLSPISAPTNFLTRESYMISVPNGKDLRKTEIAFHEYLGRMWNYIKSFKE